MFVMQFDRGSNNCLLAQFEIFIWGANIFKTHYRLMTSALYINCHNKDIIFQQKIFYILSLQ
jgi:hypothetical protein